VYYIVRKRFGVCALLRKGVQSRYVEERRGCVIGERGFYHNAGQFNLRYLRCVKPLYGNYSSSIQIQSFVHRAESTSADQLSQLLYLKN